MKKTILILPILFCLLTNAQQVFTPINNKGLLKTTLDTLNGGPTYGPLKIFGVDDQLQLSDTTRATGTYPVQAGTIDFLKRLAGGTYGLLGEMKWYMDGVTSSPTAYGIGRVTLFLRNASISSVPAMQFKPGQVLAGGSATTNFANATMTVNTTSSTGINPLEVRTSDSSLIQMKVYASGMVTIAKQNTNGQKLQVGGSIAPDSVAIGINARVYNGSQSEAVAVGNTTWATDPRATAIGNGARAVFSTAYDPTANNNGQNVALGDHAEVSSWRGTAIGALAKVGSTSATAIGFGSVADRTHSISIGRGSFIPNDTQDSIFGGVGDPINIGTGGMKKAFGLGNWYTHFPRLPRSTININPNNPEWALSMYKSQNAYYDSAYASMLSYGGGRLSLDGGQGIDSGRGGSIWFRTAPSKRWGVNKQSPLVIQGGFEGETGNFVLTDNLSNTDTILSTYDEASAKVNINSTRKGLLVPRMNTTQMNAIASPANALLIFNTDSSKFCYWNTIAWVSLSASTGGGGGGGTVLSVSGTTNRITSTGGATPVIDIGTDVVTQTGTQTLTNKTIDFASNTPTNLPTTGIANNAVTLGKMATLAANSVIGNNTSSAATPAAFTMKYVGEQTIGTTVVWNGTTAPTGETKLYRWSQNAMTRQVSVLITLQYSTPGVGNGNVTIPLPTDMPAPDVPTGLSVANACIATGSCQIVTAATTANNGIQYVRLKRNSANTGWEFVGITVTTVAVGYATISLTYFY